MVDNECRVRSLCRMKVGFDPKMQVYRTCDKPDALALRHFRRLDDFGESQNATVELARSRLATNGNGHLHMVETKDGHRRLTATWAHRRPTVKHKSSFRAPPTRGTSTRQARAAQ